MSSNGTIHEMLLFDEFGISSVSFRSKNMKKAPPGVQNACSSYDPLKNLLRNDKKCFLWVIMVSHAKPLRGYIVRLQNSFIGFIAGLTTLTVSLNL